MAEDPDVDRGGSNKGLLPLPTTKFPSLSDSLTGAEGPFDNGAASSKTVVPGKLPGKKDPRRRNSAEFLRRNWTRGRRWRKTFSPTTRRRLPNQSAVLPGKTPPCLKAGSPG